MVINVGFVKKGAVRVVGDFIGEDGGPDEGIMSVWVFQSSKPHKAVIDL